MKNLRYSTTHKHTQSKTYNQQLLVDGSDGIIYQNVGHKQEVPSRLIYLHWSVYISQEHNLEIINME